MELGGYEVVVFWKFEYFYFFFVVFGYVVEDKFSFFEFFNVVWVNFLVVVVFFVDYFFVVKFFCEGVWFDVDWICFKFYGVVEFVKVFLFWY